MAGGLKITQTGGDAQVLPTANPDQLLLFKQKQLDAVWTVEPWVARLELEAGARILYEDKDSVTTVLAARAEVLTSRRDLVRKFARANQELTDWIGKNPDEAKKLAREELAAEMHAKISEELIARSWGRITLAADILRGPLDAFVASAKSVGFLRRAPDMSRLVETP